jgi:hypothetical protein
MSKRYVTLGDGFRVGLGQYVEAWQKIKALPPGTYLPRIPNGNDGSAAEALQQFRDGMHDRINRHIPGYGKGRKWSLAWFWEAKRLASAVNTPRLVVRWAPPEFRKRLADRLEAE